MKTAKTVAGLSCVLALLAPARAHAGGLFFSDRGVRPMGRAGAFVAGADDLGAIWYNPAGLADAGTSVLVDFAWLRFSADYTRELLVLDASGTYQQFSSPKVTGSSPVLPIPTIAYSLNFGREKQWTVAAGFLDPYFALAGYPDTVGGQPSPARYTLGSLSGILAITGLWASYKPIEEIRFGLGVMAMVGTFQTTVTFGANPQDRLLGAPEQPEFDAKAQLAVGPIVAPSANAGVTFVPSRLVRIGLSGQLPMILSANGTLKMQMPSSALFDTAHQDGDSVHMRFVLPAILRAGIEVRPTRDLRIEASYVRELWSEHQSINIDPRNMSIDGVTGLSPQVHIPPIVYPRSFQDSSSYRLGSEYFFHAWGYDMSLRNGVSYETTGVPPSYLSLSSLDFDKLTLSIGGGLHLGKHWRLDGVYAHLFASSVYVDPHQAMIPRINPIKGNAPFEPVNGGRYSASADLIGFGLEYKF